MAMETGLGKLWTPSTIRRSTTIDNVWIWKLWTPPPPYSNLSNMYPPGPQYGYGKAPTTPVCYFCFVDMYLFAVLVFSLMYLIFFVSTYHYDGLEQYHDPSNMPK
jgi:hypothetical protein